MGNYIALRQHCITLLVDSRCMFPSITGPLDLGDNSQNSARKEQQYNGLRHSLLHPPDAHNHTDDQNGPGHSTHHNILVPGRTENQHRPNWWKDEQRVEKFGPVVPRTGMGRDGSIFIQRQSSRWSIDSMDRPERAKLREERVVSVPGQQNVKFHRLDCPFFAYRGNRIFNAHSGNSSMSLPIITTVVSRCSSTTYCLEPSVSIRSSTRRPVGRSTFSLIRSTTW